MKNPNELIYLKDFIDEHSYDYLTNTLKKEVILSYMNNLIKNGKSFSIYFFDIDDFKNVNDTKGHQYGDKILNLVSSRLSETIDDIGVIGRYGGDEFIIIIEDYIEYQDVWNRAKRICETVREVGKETYENDAVAISITLGSASFPTNADTVDELLEVADKALYRGKKKGRNCFIIYTPSLHAHVKTDNDTKLKPIEIIDYISTTFSKPKGTLFEKFEHVTKFLADYFLLDSLTIQDDDGNFKQVFSNSSLPNVGYIPLKCVFTDHKSKTNYRTISSRFQIANRDFIEYLQAQEIRSVIIIKVKKNNKTVGAIVASCRRDRVWTEQEKELFLVACNYYSIYLSLTNDTFNIE